MSRRLRLWLWLHLLDLALAGGAPEGVNLWLIGKASDATDWGDLELEGRR